MVIYNTLRTFITLKKNFIKRGFCPENCYYSLNFTRHAILQNTQLKTLKKTCIFVLRVIIIYEILQNMHCCHEISIIHETLTKHDFCPDIIVFIIIRTLKTNIVSLSSVSFLSLYLIHLVLTKVLPNFLPLSMFP